VKNAFNAKTLLTMSEDFDCFVVLNEKPDGSLELLPIITTKADSYKQSRFRATFWMIDI
jgi:hypothetical protein